MPSPQYSKAKGRSWENEICEWLDPQIRQEPERRRLSGVNDRGDIAGIPKLVIEAKNAREYKLPDWLRQAVTEAVNAKADFGVVWMRLMGKPRADQGVILMRPEDFLKLLAAAGYVDLVPIEDVPVSSGKAV